MIEAPFGEAKTNGMALIGSQPVALAAVALVVMVLGAGSIAVWRAYTGASPEQDRLVAARQLQIRAAQASEQLVEKTKALELTQQESIDQLQMVQDQLQTLKRILATQQTDVKRLSDQVGELTGAIDELRQSFASNQSQEASGSPSTRTNKTPSHRRRDKRRTSPAR
jgi:uncharacterized coiled-coil protein SlyX